MLDKLARAAADRGTEFLSIFYGADVSTADAERARERFAALCPDAEITLLEGGQPVYHYLISAE